MIPAVNTIRLQLIIQFDFDKLVKLRVCPISVLEIRMDRKLRTAHLKLCLLSNPSQIFSVICTKVPLLIAMHGDGNDIKTGAFDNHINP